MNCLFCQLPCSNERNKLQFYCRPCWTTYFHKEDSQLNFIELWTQINNQKYIVRLFPSEERTELKSTSPVDPKNTQSGYYHEVILELKYLAPITPTNIQDKVKTMLTFL